MSASVCQKLVVDRLAKVKEADKTSNSHSSAYVDTAEGELCSKSKCLAKQAFYPSSDLAYARPPSP